jgi:ubiquitin C-terminal hydrolase
MPNVIFFILINYYRRQVAVGQYKLQFEGYEQQDSHEFLTFLLDWMHDELKKVRICDE